MTQPDLPPALYKYSTAETLGFFLSNLCLRFTPPAGLNDPFEFGLVSDANPVNLLSNPTLISTSGEKFRAALLKAYEGNLRVQAQFTFEEFLARLDPARLDQLAKSFQAEADVAVPAFWTAFRHRNGVFSTTTHNADVLMWSHYANYHRGFRMDLDPATAFSRPDGLPLIPIKVAYQDHLPEAKADYLPNPSWYKHTHWQYENEWRFIRDVEKDPPPQGGVDMRLYPVNPAAVRSIAFGINFDASEKADMASRIRTALPGTKILQAVKARGSFAIELVDYA